MTTEIWMLSRSVSYEGLTVFGHYATAEAGLTAMREAVDKDPYAGWAPEQDADGNWHITGGMDDTYDLERCEVEG